MASAPKTRTRSPVAPIAAPPEQLQQQQPPVYPSPHPTPAFDAALFQNRPYSLNTVINVACYVDLENRIVAAIRRNRQEDKPNIIDSHFATFQEHVLTEIHRRKTEFLILQGLPATNKRGPDDCDHLSSSHSSPEAKKIKTDRPDSEAHSPEDEVNLKGSWKCLYYEEDPETHYHCKDKRYKRVSELRRHIKTHTLPHYCNICGYRTAEERRLQNHKCEPSNRKKYTPVTEEDRAKHEQLARMGIKVGQMRKILFGEKDGAESAGGSDADTASSEASRRPSITVPGIMQQQSGGEISGGFVPTDFTAFQLPVTTQQPPAPLHLVTTQSSPATTMYGAAHIPSHIIFPPSSSAFVPVSPMQGHAASYYNDPHNYSIYSGTTTYVQQAATTAGPLMPTDSKTDHSSLSPTAQYMAAYTSADEQPPPPVRTDSLNIFLNDVFPEVSGDDRPPMARNRSMPASEIAAMEEYQASRGWTMSRSLTMISRKGTALFSSGSADRPSFFARIRRKGLFTSSSSQPKSTPVRNENDTSEAPRSQNRGVLFEGLKKVFLVGIGRRRWGDS